MGNGRKRRKEPRYSTLVSVRYYTPEGQFCGFIENLSAGGMFIATHRTFPPGTAMRMEIVHPDGHQLIRLKGRVAWERKSSVSSMEKRGVGVMFEGLGAAEKDQVEGLVEELKGGSIKKDA